jgi:hypothetical protein
MAARNSRFAPGTTLPGPGIRTRSTNTVMSATGGLSGDDIDRFYPNLKKLNYSAPSSPNTSTNYRIISGAESSNATGSHTPFWVQSKDPDLAKNVRGIAKGL